MSTENKLAKLSSAQYQELKDALPLITILIAGADGKVDPQELNWAEKLTHIRTYANPEELNGFYEDVQTTFRGDLEKLMSSLPGIESTNSTLKFSPLARKKALASSRVLVDLVKGLSRAIISFIFFSMGAKSAVVKGSLRWKS